MKKLLVLTLLMLSQLVVAASKHNPDILVYTRTETQWNVFLLKEFRTFMNNLAMDIDPYSYQHNEDLIYGEENIDHYISEDAHRLMNAISTGTGIEVLNTVPELKIQSLGYTVGTINPKINPVEDIKGNVILKSDISLEKVHAFAKEISLTFVLGKDEKGLNLPSPEIKIINPRIILNKGKQIAFGLDVELREKREAIALHFHNGDFARLTQLMKEDPDLIDIQYDGIEIPEISLQIMGRNINPRVDKVLEIVENHKQSLKVILMDQLRVLFEKDGAMEIFKHFSGTSFNRDYWIVSSSESMFPLFLGIQDFSVPMKGVLAAELKGDFCTTNNYVAVGTDCVNSRVTQAPKTTISKADFSYSKTLINSTFKSDKDVKFLASISEDYLNKAIVTTVDFGIWAQILEEMEIEFGEKGVLVQLDKEGKNATVALDVIYDVGKIAGFVLKKIKLRFPVILDATIRAQEYEIEEEVDGVLTKSMKSHIVFTINNVNLNDEVLLYGHKEYGFPSNVQNVRKFLGLRNTVVKKIKKELFDYKAPSAPENFAKWKGVDLPPLLLPEIQDMYLEKMELNSDAHGRLNIILRGSETIYRN